MLISSLNLSNPALSFYPAGNLDIQSNTQDISTKENSFSALLNSINNNDLNYNSDSVGLEDNPTTIYYKAEANDRNSQEATVNNNVNNTQSQAVQLSETQSSQPLSSNNGAVDITGKTSNAMVAQTTQQTSDNESAVTTQQTGNKCDGETAQQIKNTINRATNGEDDSDDSKINKNNEPRKYVDKNNDNIVEKNDGNGSSQILQNQNLIAETSDIKSGEPAKLYMNINQKSANDPITNNNVTANFKQEPNNLISAETQKAVNQDKSISIKMLTADQVKALGTLDKYFSSDQQEELNIKSIKMKTSNSIVTQTDDGVQNERQNKTPQKQAAVISNASNDNSQISVNSKQAEPPDNEPENTSPGNISANTIQPNSAQNILSDESQISQNDLVKKNANISRMNNNNTNDANNSNIKQGVIKIDDSNSKNFSGQNKYLLNQLGVQSNKPADKNTQAVKSVNQNITTTYSNISIEDFIQITTNIAKNLPSNSTHTARLLLKPDSLGTVFVKIDLNDGSLRLKIEADNKDTVKSIESQLSVLKDNLKQQGLKIENVEIGMKNYKDDASNDQNRYGNAKENKSFVKDFIRSFKNINNTEE